MQLLGKHILSGCFMVVIACMTPASAASESGKLGPSGRYCGVVYNAGYNVKVQTIIVLEKDGRIKGTMQYDDLGVVTSGTIEEQAVTDPYNRLVRWTDKYGTGTAAMKFDSQYQRFEGLWGADDETPGYLWNGGPCADYTS